MRRSKNQIIYSALPGQFITFSSNGLDKTFAKKADQCVINVKFWNTRTITESEVYFPKIINQIRIDLANFEKTAEKPNVNMDENFKDFLYNRKELYRFLEVEIKEVNDAVKNDQNLNNEVFGNITPNLFYCPKCGCLKTLERYKNNNIIKMHCDKCNERMKQYNRLWACNCGNWEPIYFGNDIDRYKYFPKLKDGFIMDGKNTRVHKTCKECNKPMKMINATDNDSFYPKIIKSINLINNEDAKNCKTREGIELVIKRKTGEITEEQYKIKVNSIRTESENGFSELEEDNDKLSISEILGNIGGVSKTEKTTPTIDPRQEQIAYKLLEYDTLKKNVFETLEKAKERAIKNGQVADDNRINMLLKIMGISNIESISNIEIINTAYGYTRVNSTAENLSNDEELKIRSFINTSRITKADNGVIDFLNNREITEGILIELNKEKIIQYLKNNNEIQKGLKIDMDNDVELSKWFVNNPDPTIINKYAPINNEDGCTKDIYKLLHTISHMFIKSFGDYCGLDKNSLGEMIFVNVPAIFIYSQTIQGHVLGALTDMFDRNLYNVLRDTYENNKTCIFDPVCMDTSDGRCAGCAYINEVACEHFNLDLSRKVLYGFENKENGEKIVGFWEE